MTIGLNNLKNKKKKARRFGRGLGSGRGTYSGRGNKGQRSRSGGKKGLKLKGLKRTLLNAPKFKGMKNRFPKAQTVKLSVLDKHFGASDKINPAVLKEKKLISTINKPVKILFDKEITQSYEIFGCAMSQTAKTALEKAGGKYIDLNEQTENKK